MNFTASGYISFPQQQFFNWFICDFCKSDKYRNYMPRIVSNIANGMEYKICRDCSQNLIIGNMSNCILAEKRDNNKDNNNVEKRCYYCKSIFVQDKSNFPAYTCTNETCFLCSNEYKKYVKYNCRMLDIVSHLIGNKDVVGIIEEYLKFY